MEILGTATLFIVLSLLLAFNPVTIAIFTVLIAGGYGKQQPKSRVGSTALTYIVSLGLIISLLGIAWLRLLNTVSIEFVELITYVVSLTCIIWGTISLKDYYWYSQRTSAPKFVTKSIHKRTTKNHKVASAGALAVTTAFAIIPSMLLPYLGLVTLAGLFGITSWGAPAIITIALVFPLLCILTIAMGKIRLSAIMKWRYDSRMTFRLTIGLTTIFIGWLLLLVLNGTLGVAL